MKILIFVLIGILAGIVVLWLTGMLYYYILEKLKTKKKQKQQAKEQNSKSN